MHKIIIAALALAVLSGCVSAAQQKREAAKERAEVVFQLGNECVQQHGLSKETAAHAACVRRLSIEAEYKALRANAEAGGFFLHRWQRQNKREEAKERAEVIYRLGNTCIGVYGLSRKTPAHAACVRRLSYEASKQEARDKNRKEIKRYRDEAKRYRDEAESSRRAAQWEAYSAANSKREAENSRREAESSRRRSRQCGTGYLFSC
jgi:hypothetical protein